MAIRTRGCCATILDERKEGRCVELRSRALSFAPAAHSRMLEQNVQSGYTNHPSPGQPPLKDTDFLGSPCV